MAGGAARPGLRLRSALTLAGSVASRRRAAAAQSWCLIARVSEPSSCEREFLPVGLVGSSFLHSTDALSILVASEAASEPQCQGKTDREEQTASRF